MSINSNNSTSIESVTDQDVGKGWRIGCTFFGIIFGLLFAIGIIALIGFTFMAMLFSAPPAEFLAHMETIMIGLIIFAVLFFMGTTIISGLVAYKIGSRIDYSRN